jgi:hypothetical protein
MTLKKYPVPVKFAVASALPAVTVLTSVTLARDFVTWKTLLHRFSQWSPQKGCAATLNQV